MAPGNYDVLPVFELQCLCKKYYLHVSGVKRDLITRLETFDALSETVKEDHLKKGAAKSKTPSGANIRDAFSAPRGETYRSHIPANRAPSGGGRAVAYNDDTPAPSLRTSSFAPSRPVANVRNFSNTPVSVTSPTAALDRLSAQVLPAQSNRRNKPLDLTNSLPSANSSNASSSSKNRRSDPSGTFDIPPRRLSITTLEGLCHDNWISSDAEKVEAEKRSTIKKKSASIRKKLAATRDANIERAKSEFDVQFSKVAAQEKEKIEKVERIEAELKQKRASYAVYFKELKERKASGGLVVQESDLDPTKSQQPHVSLPLLSTNNPRYDRAYQSTKHGSGPIQSASSLMEPNSTKEVVKTPRSLPFAPNVSKAYDVSEPAKVSSVTKSAESREFDKQGIAKISGFSSYKPNTETALSNKANKTVVAKVSNLPPPQGIPAKKKENDADTPVQKSVNATIHPRSPSKAESLEKSSMAQLSRGTTSSASDLVDNGVRTGVVASRSRGDGELSTVLPSPKDKQAQYVRMLPPSTSPGKNAELPRKAVFGYSISSSYSGPEYRSAARVLSGPPVGDYYRPKEMHGKSNGREARNRSDDLYRPVDHTQKRKSMTADLNPNSSKRHQPFEGKDIPTGPRPTVKTHRGYDNRFSHPLHNHLSLRRPATVSPADSVEVGPIWREVQFEPFVHIRNRHNFQANPYTLGALKRNVVRASFRAHVRADNTGYFIVFELTDDGIQRARECFDYFRDELIEGQTRQLGLYVGGKEETRSDEA